MFEFGPPIRWSFVLMSIKHLGLPNGNDHLTPDRFVRRWTKDLSCYCCQHSFMIFWMDDGHFYWDNFDINRRTIWNEDDLLITYGFSGMVPEPKDQVAEKARGRDGERQETAGTSKWRRRRNRRRQLAARAPFDGHWHQRFRPGRRRPQQYARSGIVSLTFRFLVPIIIIMFLCYWGSLRFVLPK